MAGGSGGKGSKKKGRNEAACKAYGAARRMEVNKLRKIGRHIREKGYTAATVPAEIKRAVDKLRGAVGNAEQKAALKGTCLE